ncbi:hypothetical protein DSM03_103198 [Leeuwenhoekiella aestuarii]|uniref:Uncharacterized protein n=1 Tax=Leeuwenhoekiella aestuarii TaxID=2249426 RepID=A0A4Q0NWT7_9FLAO|nr:hypothetical protein [Leeuwenhoekiella aestuarii]RXG16013.1 hypothetical protein DSM03_103198 [Leeuwenhoekiella aestuarii]RXG16707.1 hypothetical protein DSM04_102288 [Leeuwenhoekiella aestuarii]
MRLSEKDRKFIKDWQVKRASKVSFFLGVILQIVLLTVTYKLVLTFIFKEIFDLYIFLEFAIFGLVLGLVMAFLKYRMNEKRYKRLKSGK